VAAVWLESPRIILCVGGFALATGLLIELTAHSCQHCRVDPMLCNKSKPSCSNCKQQDKVRRFDPPRRVPFWKNSWRSRKGSHNASLKEGRSPPALSQHGENNSNNGKVRESPVLPVIHYRAYYTVNLRPILGKGFRTSINKHPWIRIQWSPSLGIASTRQRNMTCRHRLLHKLRRYSRLGHQLTPSHPATPVFPPSAQIAKAMTGRRLIQ
jgi:hypothetical protein